MADTITVKSAPFYDISPRRKAWAPVVPKAWRQEEINRLFCPECFKTIPDHLDVTVMDETPGKAAFGLLLAGYTSFARRDFVEFLGREDIERVFGFGSLLSSNPEIGPFPDYVTLTPRIWDFIPRGNRGSRIARCRTCRRIQYSPEIPLYFVEGHCPTIDLFPSTLTIGISNKLAASRDWTKWKSHIYLEPVKVLDKPRDGFPVDLSEVE